MVVCVCCVGLSCVVVNLFCCVLLFGLYYCLFVSCIWLESVIKCVVAGYCWLQNKLLAHYI